MFQILVGLVLVAGVSFLLGMFIAELRYQWSYRGTPRARLHGRLMRRAMRKDNGR